ncbi:MULTISPECIES: hypothetical protein [unclassified Enterobacter]|uniref:hypothetical protein n=1 Tax=unclassified Enterobacter TaxID=2608935 RepID=UPI003862C3B0|nr:hypothetical protein [Enterobacter chengduensis]
MTEKAAIVFKNSKGIELDGTHINGHGTAFYVDNVENFHSKDLHITAHTDSEELIKLKRLIYDNIEIFELDDQQRTKLRNAIISLNDTKNPSFLESLETVSTLTANAVTIYPAIAALLTTISASM